MNPVKYFSLMLLTAIVCNGWWLVNTQNQSPMILLSIVSTLGLIFWTIYIIIGNWDNKIE
jgi:hypothetical protein